MLKRMLAVASNVVLFAAGANATTLAAVDLTGQGSGDLGGVGTRSPDFDVDGVTRSVHACSTYYGGYHAVLTDHVRTMGTSVATARWMAPW